MRIKQDEEEEEILEQEEENQLGKRQGTAAAGYNRLLGTVVPPVCTQALYGYFFFFLGSINLYGSAAQCSAAPLDKSKWAR